MSKSLIATLIANPKNPVLTPELADKALRAANASTLYWLADGIACDIPLEASQNIKNTTLILRDALNGAPIDVVVQEQQTRRKKLLIADMDSTMIEQECIDELADEAGLGEHVATITKRTMNGEIEFETALRERVALLKGLPLEIIEKIIHERITLMPGGKELVGTMRKNDAYTALVSGGFTFFTEKIAKIIGFNENSGNILEYNEGILVGTVRDPILGRQAKLDKLIELCERLDLTPEQAMAVGDGANDLAMLRRAGSGVALHAKPIVAEAVSMRIDNGDLTALLYIQGFRQHEFFIFTN